MNSRFIGSLLNNYIILKFPIRQVEYSLVFQTILHFFKNNIFSAHIYIFETCYSPRLYGNFNKHFTYANYVYSYQMKECYLMVQRSFVWKFDLELDFIFHQHFFLVTQVELWTLRTYTQRRDPHPMHHTFTLFNFINLRYYVASYHTYFWSCHHTTNYNKIIFQKIISSCSPVALFHWKLELKFSGGPLH